MAKFIRFDKTEEIFAGRETYNIINKRYGTILGQILQYPPWRQWICRFNPDSIWSQDCLTDIAEFLRSLPK